MGPNAIVALTTQQAIIINNARRFVWICSYLQRKHSSNSSHQYQCTSSFHGTSIQRSYEYEQFYDGDSVKVSRVVMSLFIVD